MCVGKKERDHGNRQQRDFYPSSNGLFGGKKKILRGTMKPRVVFEQIHLTANPILYRLVDCLNDMRLG